MRVACSLLFCLCHFAVFSQDRASPDYTEIKGWLMDSLTSQPVSSAHIWTRHFAVVSNADGSFAILTLPNDSIHFSHISYHTEVVAVRSLKNISSVRIEMRQKVTLLNSVDIYNILSEENFKKKILATTPEESPEEQNARANMAALSYYLKSLPLLPMNANENFREYMKGPQGVTIFSTSKQKGLIKAIRDVIKTKPVPFKSFSGRNSSTTDFKFPILNDSLFRKDKSRSDSLKSVDHH